MKNKLLRIGINSCGILLYAFVLFFFSRGMQFISYSVKNVIGNFIWTIIYFVFPVIAFFLAILLKFRIRKTLLISIVPIIIYALISFGTIITINYYLKDFSQDKWAKYQSERYRMLDNMTNKIDFIGMTKEEVIKILGEPDNPYAATDNIDLIDYYVGSFSIDPTMITFVFENNKVTEVYEYTEFRTSKKSLY